MPAAVLVQRSILTCFTYTHTPFCSPVTTLCRFQCGEEEVCILPRGLYYLSEPVKFDWIQHACFLLARLRVFILPTYSTAVKNHPGTSLSTAWYVFPYASLIAVSVSVSLSLCLHV